MVDKCHKQIKVLFSYLFITSRGAVTRIKIVSLLRQRPLNPGSLSVILQVDYKTIRHHINVLEKNNLIYNSGNQYGKMYFLSTLMKSNMMIFDKITTMFINCADCRCTSQECRESKSAKECPNCTLKECCCWLNLHN